MNAHEVAMVARSGAFAMHGPAYKRLAAGALAGKAQRDHATGKEFGGIATFADGIVTVPVIGLLVTHDSWLTEYYAATSYTSILQDITRAVESPRRARHCPAGQQ